MTPEEVRAARVLVDAASSGPWEPYRSDSGYVWADPGDGRMIAKALVSQADVKFIAAARTLVPRLLDALEEAWSQRDAALMGERFQHSERGYEQARAQRAEALAEERHQAMRVLRDQRDEARAQSSAGRWEAVHGDAGRGVGWYVRTPEGLWGDGPYSQGIAETQAARENAYARLHPVTSVPAEGDRCRAEEVDGEPVLVHGDEPMTETDRGYFAEVVRAARARFAAEHRDGRAT